MRHIIHYISRLFKNSNRVLLLYGLIFLVFLTNATYVMYPDEFVNMLGGKFINMGKIPYRDFFDHHLPFAWYFSAVLEWFSFGSYVMFRIWWSVIAFVSLLAVSFYVKKTKPEAHPFYLAFFFLYPFIGVYYWTHLFLADSLAYLFFSIIFWIFVIETYQKETGQKILYLLSFLIFCFIFSSLTFVYVALFFYLWLFYLRVRRGFLWKNILKLIGACLLPFVVYFLYLLVTGSLNDFYISNVVYNTKLYINIPNYTKGRFFNPIKFALTVIFNFYQEYIPLLVRIKEFNLFFPVDLVMALGTFLLLGVFFLENKIIFLLYFLILSFSSPRSTILKIGETDYQVSIFLALGFASTFIVYWRYKHIQLKEEYTNYFKKGMVALLTFYLIFASLFLIKNTFEKFYMRYTQKMPGIYDIAYTGSFIDDVLKKGEYFWVGPYEPHESFFVKNALLPGKFPTLLPQFREDEYFKASFLKQFEQNPPQIIIYKHEASIFMTPAMEFGAFFVDWMKGKYTSIENIQGIRLEKSPSSFNFRTDLYIRNDQMDELLNRLKEKGYISFL